MEEKQTREIGGLSVNVTFEGLDEGLAKMKELEATLTRCIRKQKKLNRLSRMRRPPTEKPYWLK